MDKGIAPLEIKNEVTDYDKEILSIALDGIYGWKFNPVAVITNGMEDYYFICKVKTMIETIQMKMANQDFLQLKKYVNISKDLDRN